MGKKAGIVLGIIIGVAVGGPALVAALDLQIGPSIFLAENDDDATDSDGDAVKKVHGSVNIGDGDSAGAVNTVNGSVEVGSGAQVASVKVVNGSVRLKAAAVVRGGVKSVNGSISLDRDAHVREDVTNVNGRISMDEGAIVDGAVGNVNGRINLDGAEVGSLATTNGSIELRNGTVINGDLTVRKPDNKGFNLFGKSNPPRVVIGENCQVHGDLIFEQEVELEIADSASVGAIRGVEPIRK